MQTIRFGTDGWRGVIADDFTFAAVRRVAAAYARCLGGVGRPARVIVGHDTRFQAAAFARAAAEVLVGLGVEVHLTAVFAPTPAFAWAAVDRGADGALVLTASHNPPAYLGIKCKDRHGAPASPDFTAVLEAELDRDDEASPAPARSAPGRIVPFDPRPSYADRLAGLVDLEAIAAAGFPVIVDAMGGAGQGLLAGLLAARRVVVTELGVGTDPLFAGRNPEPVPANLGELQARCAAGAAVGFALDGDADRLACVDETGRPWSPHQLLAVVVDHMARRRGGRGRVVKGFAVGVQVDAVAAAWGLPVEVVPIGFKYIAAHMLKGDVLVGGEESGGIGVQGHLPERDGSLVALLVLEAMAREGRRAADLLDHIEAQVGPSHYRRVDWVLPRGLDREAILRRLEGLRRGLPGEAPAAVDELDGLKLRFADGSWILFRPSGTEPLLRVYAEGASAARVDGLLAAAAAAVRGAMGDVIEGVHANASA
jgi:phosphomannomutase